MERFKFAHAQVTWLGIEQVAPYVMIKGYKYWIVGTQIEKHGLFHDLKSDQTGVIKQIAHSDLCRVVDK